MIPTQNNIVQNDFEFAELPSRTFKINENPNKKYIHGVIDNLEAVKQAIYLMLNIERYKHLIYSWDYGIELKDLYGQDCYYVMAELERRIKEALLQDDRIKEITDFDFEKHKNIIHCTFTVKTIYGDIKTEKTIEV